MLREEQMSQRVLFARVGWMRWYRGQRPDDGKPVGGGSYNENELGYETFNFLPIGDRLFGAFQPPNSTVRLERIEPKFRGDTLAGVLLIFVASNPEIGGQYIIGWYRNATLYRHEQSSGKSERKCIEYLAETTFGEGVLVPEPNRLFAVPKGAGGFGQANVCYVFEDNGNRKADSPWIDKALEYVSSYQIDNAAHDSERAPEQGISGGAGRTIECAAVLKSKLRIRMGKAIDLPFTLQFDAAEIPPLAGRYGYQQDSGAMDAGKRIRSGDCSRENLTIIFRWKTGGRGISRLSKNSDEEIADALQLAVNARTERAAISVLCGLSGADVPVASAILTAIDPVRYTIIDFRALEALGQTTSSVDYYLAYLAACRGLSTEVGVSLRDLDRALGSGLPNNSRFKSMPLGSVLPRRLVPCHPQNVGLAADLTILDARLLCSGRGVNDGLVPLAATSALES